MVFVPEVHFVGHPDVAGDVALVHDFSIEHLRDEAVGEEEEEEDGTEADADLSEELFLVHGYHAVTESSRAARDFVRLVRVYCSTAPVVAARPG